MDWTITTIGESHGITIKTHYRKQKNGKERIWVEMRQKKEKPWKMYSAHVYGRGADVSFLIEPKNKSV